MIEARESGTSGPLVAILHGGPGAGGYLAPIAEVLAPSFRVLEPLQRGAGDEPLTVARHVEDLRALIEHHAGDSAVTLVGHSWGAMLALAFGAAHADLAGPMVLVGCGTFDETARATLHRSVEQRMDDRIRQEIASLQDTVSDPDERFRRWGELLAPVYSVELAATPQLGRCDRRAYDETLQDMLRLQATGRYPQAFKAVTTPVLMLHGDEDPHPGEMICAGLRPHLPQLEYRELNRCGHYPWLERHARESFFEVLGSWLMQQSGAEPSPAET